MAETLPNGTLSLTLPTDAAHVAKLQRSAEADRETLLEIAVTDAESCAVADALLSDAVTKRDAIVAMRRTATVPLYGVIKTVEGWFAPVVAALEAGERHLKKEIGAYRLAQEKLAQEARALAADAARSGDADALHTAITVAQDASEKPAGVRASVALHWTVERVAMDLLADEYKLPNMKALEAIAKQCKGDEPPVIPGVVFRRAAGVGARR